MNIISLEQGKTMAERLLEEALFRLDISNFVNSNAPCEIIGLTMRYQVEKIQTYQWRTGTSKDENQKEKRIRMNLQFSLRFTIFI